MDIEFAADARAEMMGLGYGGYLLVATVRRMVAQRGLCPAVLREFSEAFGKDADEAVATARLFFSTVGIAARRRVCVGLPGWAGLTDDERVMLDMVKAAQARDPAMLASTVCRFASTEDRQRLAHAAYALASTFAAHDFCFDAAPQVTSVRSEAARVAR